MVGSITCTRRSARLTEWANLSFPPESYRALLSCCCYGKLAVFSTMVVDGSYASSAAGKMDSVNNDKRFSVNEISSLTVGRDWTSELIETETDLAPD